MNGGQRISTYQKRYATFGHVPWGVVELEPEVVGWIQGLPDDQFGRVEFYIDLLEEKGVHLDQPYTRQLRGKLRELRFYVGPGGGSSSSRYSRSNAGASRPRSIVQSAP